MLPIRCHLNAQIEAMPRSYCRLMSDNAKCWPGLGAAGTLPAAGVQSHIATLEDRRGVSYRAKCTRVQCNSHLVLSQKNWKHNCTTPAQVDTLIAPLFIITKTWKQPTCSSVSDWIKCTISRRWTIIQC